MKNNGFTLLELSIVLVIIGLIVGGITVGSSMIRAAELRSVITEQQQFKSAIYTFKDKYFGLPGDLSNAVQFWGAAAGSTADGYDATCGALTYTSPSTGTETCNGDDDGWIQNGADVPERYERFRAWQHLANAGLISGSYTGVPNAAINYTAGENGPASKLGSTGWTFGSYPTSITGSASLFDVTGFTAMELRNSTATNYISLTPEEVWNIDKKIDDGKPGQGKVGAYKPTYQANCATTAVNSTAEYNLPYDGIACSFIFLLKGSFR